MRRAAVVLLLIVLSSPATSSTDPRFSKDELDAFRICRRFGFLDVKDRPMVTVKEFLYEGEDGPEFGTNWAFVLAEKPDGERRILDGSFVYRSLRSVEVPAERGQALLTPTDLPSVVRAALNSPRRNWLVFDAPDSAGENEVRLVLAAQCLVRGRGDLARQLLDTLTPWEERSGLTCARDRLSVRLLWRTVLDFQDLNLSRTELPDRFRLWLDSFPKAREDHRAKARRLLEELTRMGPEDDAHVKACPLPADAPEAARIADLVWHLRDARGGQWMQPGSPSVFATFDGTENAAHALSKIGWPAIDALIEAIDDTRPTRTVGFWRNFTFSHYVVRVGDAAYAVLVSIVGQRFWKHTYTAASMVKDGDAPSTKAKIQAWWKEYDGPGGELRWRKRQYADKSGWQRSQFLKEIAKRFPEEALELARATLEAAEGPEERREALEGIAVLEHPEVLPILEAALAGEESLLVRVALALALVGRGGQAEKIDLRSLWNEAVEPGSDADRDTLCDLACSLGRRSDAERAAVVEAARKDPERVGRIVSNCWSYTLFRSDAPRLSGVARDYVADLALQRLGSPLSLHPEDFRSLDPAARTLARLGERAWDSEAPVVQRIRAAHELVRAECDRRKRPPPAVPRLLARVQPETDSDPLTMTSLSLAAGNPFVPGDEALEELKALLGTVPTAASLERAIRAAFRHRPKGSGEVVLRLTRTDGFIAAEVAWFEKEREGVQINVGIGDGEGCGWTSGQGVVGDTPIMDMQFGRQVVEEITRRLRRAARGDWLLDLTFGNG